MASLKFKKRKNTRKEVLKHSVPITRYYNSPSKLSKEKSKKLARALVLAVFILLRSRLLKNYLKDFLRYQ
jgi:hypothetical protein